MKIKFNSKLYTLFLILIAAILGGASGVFGKIALKEIPSFSFTFLRFLIALLFLLPFSMKHLPTFKKGDWKIIVLSILASVNVILFSFGIKYTTANVSQMIYTAVPIVSALLSFYFFHERFGTKKISGIIIGFLGTALIVLLPIISNNNLGSMTGNILIVFAMISISVYWVLSKKFQSIYSPLKINNYFILSTTILLFFLSFYDIVKTPNWYHNVSINAYAALIFIAIFCTAITYLLNQILIKRTTPVLASMVLYLQPFATFIRAYIFLSEGLSLLFIIGAGITLLGIGIYNFSKNTNLGE